MGASFPVRADPEPSITVPEPMRCARALSGDPKNPSTQTIPDVGYAEFARLVGLDGVRVETHDEIESAWDAAFSAACPFVIDAVVDPNVPPLPPHLTVKEARSLLKALRSGDPDARGVVTESFRQKFSSSCRAGSGRERLGGGRRAAAARETLTSRLAR